MKEYLSLFCTEYDYPTEAREALLSAYVAVSVSRDASKIFTHWLLTYEKRILTKNWGELLEDLELAARYAGIPHETAKLLFLILLTVHARKLYAEAGLSESLFHDSFADLKWKLFECHRLRGIWGIATHGWAAGWFDLTRFTLGRLQFELCPAKRVICAGGVTLERGDLMINTHIPSSGPLDHAAVLDSYNRAAAFFAPRLSGHLPVIHCSSWLLFPKHAEILPENSNIRRFLADFSLYDWGTDENGGDLWRIFYAEAEKPASELPRNTALERAYADLLARGEHPGFGCGILIPPCCRC